MTIYVELPHAVGVLEALGLHVRYIGLLSSALARPSSSMFGTEAHPELEETAFALVLRAAQNHASLAEIADAFRAHIRGLARGGQQAQILRQSPIPKAVVAD